jgi:hypothetical protein
MAAFCIQFGQSPEVYKSLTLEEIMAFWDMAQPKTDLTGLF